MGYYLVPFLTDTRPRYRPMRRVLGFDRAPWNLVRFGPHHAVVWFDDPVSDARLTKLADGSTEPLAQTTRAALAPHLSDRAVVQGRPFDVAIVDALTRPPAAWGFSALRPQADGEMVIWLGPGGRGANKFYSARTPPEKHSKFFADNFNRANGALDGTTLSNSSTTWSAEAAWEIVSNQLQTTTIGDFEAPAAITVAEGDTDDAFSLAQLVTLSQTGTSAIYAEVAAQLPSTLLSGYAFSCRNDGGGTGARELYEASGFSVLAADAVLTTSGPIALYRSGSSLSGQVDGVTVLGPVTDTSQPSGVGNRHVGVTAFYIDDGGAGARTITLDNWKGGDLNAPWSKLAMAGVG